METVNVKMLKEGKRTIIIVEGADEVRDEVAYRILSTYYGLERGIPLLPDTDDVPGSAAPTEAPENGEDPPAARTPMPGLMNVKGLTPAPEEPVEAPDEAAINQMENYASARQRNHHLVPYGPYNGMTPVGALMRDRENALVVFFYMAKEMNDSAEKDEIVRACKQYMGNLPNTIKDYPDRESKLNCIVTLSKLGSLAACINGYQSLKDFCDNAADSEVDNVFKLVLYSFQDRAFRK